MPKISQNNRKVKFNSCEFLAKVCGCCKYGNRLGIAQGKNWCMKKGMKRKDMINLKCSQFKTYAEYDARLNKKYRLKGDK